MTKTISKVKEWKAKYDALEASCCMIPSEDKPNESYLQIIIQFCGILGAIALVAIGILYFN